MRKEFTSTHELDKYHKKAKLAEAITLCEEAMDDVTLFKTITAEAHTVPIEGTEGDIVDSRIIGTPAAVGAPTTSTDQSGPYQSPPESVETKILERASAAIITAADRLAENMYYNATILQYYINTSLHHSITLIPIIHT